MSILTKELCQRLSLWVSRPVVNGSAFSQDSSKNINKSGDKNKQVDTERHRDAEKEPLPEWPDGINPHTGEKGGPKGPEPTRYGDWERKGRVSDF